MSRRKVLFLAIVILTVLVLVVPGLMLSRGKVLGERHHDFTEAAFAYDNSSFSDYIEYSRQRLLAGRVGQPDEEVIGNLLPFELPLPDFCERAADGRAEQGVLLVHGLIASPYSMKDLGLFLQSQCFHVLGLLLPDHGSRPGDFLSTHWEQWAQATHFAAQRLAEVADRQIIGGHSAGGTLAILEAAQNPQIESLLLFAPALQITPAAKYARFVVPYGRLFAKAAWFEVREDEALYRYESVTFSAAAETYALIQATLVAESSRLQALPVFTVASVEDNTVDTESILAFMERNTNPRSHTLLYSQHDFPGRERMTVVPSHDEGQGVLSVSHLGLMTPPSHAYYGRDGAYRNCGHYGDAGNADFVSCKRGERSWYGEATAENLQQGIIERIAFNPYYSAMLAELTGFL